MLCIVQYRESEKVEIGRVTFLTFQHIMIIRGYFHNEPMKSQRSEGKISGFWY